MQFVLLGLIVLWLLVLLGRGTIRANPAALAGLIRNGGGILTLAGVALAVARGQLGLGGALLAFAIWMLTGARRPSWGGFGMGGTGSGSKGESRTASAWLDMQINHATGEISGRVVQGPFASRDLSDLSQEDCAVLHRGCVTADPQGARLLEAYFDRRFPGWRQAGEGDTDAGQGGRGIGARVQPGMTEKQAYEVLGIKQGASSAEIGGAHRALMKKCHPDHGGTADLAARVNEARDVLMRRHK